MTLRRCLLTVLVSTSVPVFAEAQSTVDVPPILYFPGANSRPTYFTIHNVREAWAHSTGAGVKVGILDHSFGIDEHPELYAGGESFHTDDWGDAYRAVSHHGFWMASTLREIAPGVEIYALGTYSSDEAAKVDAMVRAIEWAIENGLDVLTYYARAFSPEHIARLHEAVDRAVEAGIVTTFIHYPHPDNLLPGWLGPMSGDDGRQPDVNILHYDHSVVFTERYADWMERGSESGYRPFLSMSSTSPVTAGFVALLLSLRPDLSPAQVKILLMETSHAITFEGNHAPRTVDIGAAVRAAAGG
jgi:hypothetical protein